MKKYLKIVQYSCEEGGGSDHIEFIEFETWGDLIKDYTLHKQFYKGTPRYFELNEVNL